MALSEESLLPCGLGMWIVSYSTECLGNCYSILVYYFGMNILSTVFLSRKAAPFNVLDKVFFCFSFPCNLYWLCQESVVMRRIRVFIPRIDHIFPLGSILFHALNVLVSSATQDHEPSPTA